MFWYQLDWSWSSLKVTDIRDSFCKYGSFEHFLFFLFRFVLIVCASASCDLKKGIQDSLQTYYILSMYCFCGLAGVMHLVVNSFDTSYYLVWNSIIHYDMSKNVTFHLCHYGKPFRCFHRTNQMLTKHWAYLLRWLWCFGWLFVVVTFLHVTLILL